MQGSTIWNILIFAALVLVIITLTFRVRVLRRVVMGRGPSHIHDAAEAAAAGATK